MPSFFSVGILPAKTALSMQTVLGCVLLISLSEGEQVSLVEHLDSRLLTHVAIFLIRPSGKQLTYFPGNRVANICRSLGMAAHFAERKNTPPHLVRSSHTPFTTVLAQSTILFITLPLTAETLNLISTPEFNIMQNDVLLINVARGGIVDETALITALKEKKIGGAATDVFVEEPATLENSVLVQATNKWAEEDSELDGRLVLSPHIAWWARSSIKKLRTEVGLNIEAWAAGATRNVVL